MGFGDIMGVETTYCQPRAVVEIDRLLLVQLVVAPDVEARGVGARDDIVKQLEGDGRVRLGLVEEFLQERVGEVGGQEVVDDGAGGVVTDVVGIVQTDGRALFR